MKKLFFAFSILLSFSVNAQMARTEMYSNGIYYIEYRPTTKTPLGVVLFLHGDGECGTNQLSLIDRNDPTKSLKAGLEVPFIVIAPQLQMTNHASTPLWLPQDYDPAISICRSYALPIHLTGLSLGAMAIPGIITANPTVFKSAASVAGLVNVFAWNGIPSEQDQALPYFLKIPSRFYYGTTDKVISKGAGYINMKAFSDLLISKGADNTWVGYTGRGHDIWPDAYKDYWPWLLSKSSLVVAVGAPTVTIDSISYKKGMADMKARILSTLGKLN